MDYETTAGTLYLNGEFLVADGWTMSIDGAYTATEASFDPLEVETPEETVAKADYDYSEINSYSDLKFAQFEVSSRVTRRISERASAYVGVGYFDLTDDAPYVYGDVTGSVLYTQSGVQVRF